MEFWRPLNEGVVNGGQTGGYCPGIGHFIATNEQQIDFGQVWEGTSERWNKKVKYLLSLSQKIFYINILKGGLRIEVFPWVKIFESKTTLYTPCLKLG